MAKEYQLTFGLSDYILYIVCQGVQNVEQVFT